MAKSLEQKEAKLGGELLDTLSEEASTSSIRARFFDSDDKRTQRTPDAATLKFTFDSENTQGKKTEFIICASHSTTNGITTLSGVTRGLQRDATIDLTGSATRAQAWDAGTPIGVSTEPTNDNLMKAYFEGSEPVPSQMEFDAGVQMDGTIEFEDSDVTVRRDGNDLKFKDLSQSEVTLATLAATGGADEKVGVTINDTTPDYLDAKLTAGDGLTKTEVNDGGNETLDLDVDTSDTTVFVKTSSGAGDEDKVPVLNASGQLDSGFVDTSSIITTPTSQSGTGSTSSTGNINIDLSPFTDTDVLQIQVYFRLNATINLGGTSDDRAGEYFKAYSGILGGEYAGWFISETQNGVLSTSPFGDPDTGTLNTPSFTTDASGTITVSSAGPTTATTTIAAPTMSGSTLTFAVTIDTGSVNVSVVATRLSS